MVLVTSANGHVGGIIVKALAFHGIPVRAFGRAGDAGLPRLENGVEYLTGDFFDPLRFGAPSKGGPGIPYRSKRGDSERPFSPAKWNMQCGDRLHLSRTTSQPTTNAFISAYGNRLVSATRGR